MPPSKSRSKTSNATEPEFSNSSNTSQPTLSNGDNFIAQDVDVLPPTSGHGGRKKQDNPMTEHVLHSMETGKPRQFSGVGEDNVKRVLSMLRRAAADLKLGLDIRVSGDVITFQSREKRNRQPKA